jgi:polysaccharide export outer membrane protein
MSAQSQSKRLPFLRVLLFLGVLSSGCVIQPTCADPPDNQIPKELAKVSLPPYTIETPDVLLIDALRVIPKPPLRIEPFDALYIQVPGAPATEPISGVFLVESDGTVNFGTTYKGPVSVEGMTLAEAKAAIEKHLKDTLDKPRATVSLAQSRALQQIRGEHLVRPDGTVSLGNYGSVYVNGMTVAQAKQTIETHLAQYLVRPEISLDIQGYNSKVYYVIMDLAGAGQQVVRLPLTGNETVLDAMSHLNGLPPAASKKRIWVARPSPAEMHCDQIMPVNWPAITQGGSTATNYQLLPGDRIYVQADFLINADTTLAKVLSPIERAFGVTLLATTTVQTIEGKFNTGVVR